MKAGWLISERQRAAWHNSSKETTKRGAEVLALSEDLKERVEEVLKTKERLNIICSRVGNTLR